MFTGIITHVGALIDLQESEQDLRVSFTVESNFLADCVVGDSISVSGACLTVVEIGNDQFSADVSGETLDKTTLGGWQKGRKVNLEKSLQLSSRLGGHMVSGHVDTKALLVSRTHEGGSQKLEFEVAAKFAKYIATKGSVCLDGISLTVNEIDTGSEMRNRFCVNVVPHTLQVTTLGKLKIGEAVNLEVDMIARYLERLVGGDQESSDNNK
jgi:riboflavin synthase